MIGKAAACARHADRSLILYCRDCSLATCELCFILQHNGHSFADIEQVLDQLRAQLDGVLERMQNRTSALGHQLDTILSYRDRLASNIDVRTAVSN